MPDLHVLIGVLYACNLMAEQAPLPQSQVQSCVKVHDAVKTEFLTAAEVAELKELSTVDQFMIRLRGYRRFKAWEMKNPGLVKKIRSEQAQLLVASKVGRTPRTNQ